MNDKVLILRTINSSAIHQQHLVRTGILLLMLQSNYAGILPAPRDHGSCPSSSVPPHSRDVASPWGSMRVYEWGAIDGKKVLLIHGLSTPSPALVGIGSRLVEGGCRVMIIDLWGRGFSDTCIDVPHDQRLYISQFILAISISPLDWTGQDSGGFSIIGYSMGGALAMAFARWFPSLVNDIVLLAPGGLYRKLPKEYRALRVRFPWLFPKGVVTKYIRELLNGTTGKSWMPELTRSKSTFVEKEVVEACQNDLNVDEIVNWEIDHHPGFVHSVSSALKYAPVVKQYALWTEVRHHLEGRSKLTLPADTPSRLEGRKILLLLGKDDTVLHSGYRKDIEQIIGLNNLEIHEFEGGHSFPVGSRGKQVAETILNFWSMVI